LPATKLAAANIRITHDKVANLKGFLELIAEAISQKVDVLVLPEMALQGYADFAYKFGTKGCAEQRKYFSAEAETIPGPSTELIRRALKDSQLHVQLGLAERALHGNVIFNSTALVGPEGVVGSYRKVHNQFEFPYFSPGNEISVFDLPFGRVGSLICYDIAFPELARTLALKGAEVALMSTAWPMKGHDRGDDYHGFVMDLTVKANAFFNQMWVVISNHCEKGAYSADLDYYGNSQIVDPWGRVVADSGDEEGLVLLETDVHEKVLEARTEAFFGHNLLQDRRPELYGGVSDVTGYGGPPVAGLDLERVKEGSA
jgi:predicted amidohydrolase